MHQVQVVEVGIGSSNGSKHSQYMVPTRSFVSPYKQFPLDATTSPDVGDQQVPSPTTTS